MNTHLDNSNISKHLGKITGYKSTYDPSLLVAEPRQNNRKHLNINDDALPFVGYDIWNAYEVSCLTNDGMPVAAIAKIVYPCTSKYIVESKSIKLYMNSFNMQVIKGSAAQVTNELQSTIARDLSKLLETDVKVHVRLAHSVDDTLFYPPVFRRSLYPTLENNIDVTMIEAKNYSETPSLLSGIESTVATVQRFHSALLKSNCRVTSQPDWGDVYIHYKGAWALNPTSLLKYIVSFRDECHFHEEICETIYKRILDRFAPEELVVSCLYVRRGGIDINPTRANKESLLDKPLVDETKYFTKTVRQ
ncbi:MAG: NADPH-dependent 7-cyano-7-deazaguanine reductase QueF [Alphaproteobacteria bacterium]|nr:NADPH-dependent 7-cyano-7-deazaguanine reductase QueF [Alphaproteobacteria bacterium]